MADPRLLTRAQVADLLSVSVDTVDRHTAAGRLRCVRVGRLVRYRPADVEAFVDGNMAGAAARQPARENARGAPSPRPVLTVVPDNPRRLHLLRDPLAPS